VAPEDLPNFTGMTLKPRFYDSKQPKMSNKILLLRQLRGKPRVRKKLTENKMP